MTFQHVSYFCINFVDRQILCLLGALIECYETQHFPEPVSDQIGVLKFLMDEHGLKQGDLSEIGSQGVVSEILNRKRELNVRQIKTLSSRFNVSPAVFFYGE